MRGPRNAVDPARPYAWWCEQERTRDDGVEAVATVLISNQECPFHCLMCDLWKNTTTSRVPPDSVVGQIKWALEQLPPCRHVKLYNSGSFFDSQAIPTSDWRGIAGVVGDHRTVIVESHPNLIGPKSAEFAQLVRGELQVAMGLETVDPRVLPHLNKRMTPADFERATRFLSRHSIPVRAFVLLRAPFQSEQEGVDWAKRSLDWAFSIGVECCVIIPTRGGNGAMDWLQQRGLFAPPRLDSLEEVLQYGIGLGRGRVFADLWECDKMCLGLPDCSRQIERLRHMNLTQQRARLATDRGG